MTTHMWSTQRHAHGTMQRAKQAELCPCSLRPQTVQQRDTAGRGTSRHQPSQRLQPCRVTNTSDEIYRAMRQKVPTGDTEDTVLVSELEVHHPELGPLENRIGKLYLQELFEDSGVDVEETAYWFHTPPDGWSTKPVAYRAAEEAPVTFPEPEHLDAQAANRAMHEELQEGQVITGVLTDCWLYHGIQVDFGAQYDGLVPIPQDIWMEEGVREALLPGVEVVATIHKLRQGGLYRWPVQLQLLEPSWIARMLPDPEAYQPPINHEWCEEQGWGPQEICAATGRQFEPATFMMPDDQASAMEEMELAYGFDDPENNHYYRDPYWRWNETIGQQKINDMASELM